MKYNIEEVAEDYKSGMSIKEIRKKHNIKDSKYIYKILKKQDVEVENRKTGPVKCFTEEEVDELERRISKGEKAMHLAYEKDVHLDTIYKNLRKRKCQN